MTGVFGLHLLLISPPPPTLPTHPFPPRHEAAGVVEPRDRRESRVLRRFRRELQVPHQLAVLRVLAAWLRDYRSDFALDKFLVAELHRFFEEARPHPAVEEPLEAVWNVYHSIREGPCLLPVGLRVLEWVVGGGRIPLTPNLHLPPAVISAHTPHHSRL